ncbi:MAG: hypothetical protein HZA92_15540 [Verrucomicrobia bacterium]|nr:hypothetical protein [Verrucomicrobiota bacterium]
MKHEWKRGKGDLPRRGTRTPNGGGEHGRHRQDSRLMFRVSSVAQFHGSGSATPPGQAQISFLQRGRLSPLARNPNPAPQSETKEEDQVQDREQEEPPLLDDECQNPTFILQESELRPSWTKRRSGQRLLATRFQPQQPNQLRHY